MYWKTSRSLISKRSGTSNSSRKINGVIVNIGLMSLYFSSGYSLLAKNLWSTKGITPLKNKKIEEYNITPRRRALLNTIRFAEGTWKEGKEIGYRLIYGGEIINDLSRHPEKKVVRRYKSSAAGAYQFIPSTWKEVAKERNLTSFSPKDQDQAAIHLVNKRNALKKIDSEGLTRKTMELLSYEWASLPKKNGKSAYGQPVKTHNSLVRFYRKNLKSLENASSAERVQ